MNARQYSEVNVPENDNEAPRGPRSIVARPLSEMTEAERKQVLDEDARLVEQREAAIAKAQKAAPSTTRRTVADSK